MQSDSQTLRLGGCVWLTEVEAGEATPSQPNQLQLHHCPSFLAAGIISGYSYSFPLSLSHGPAMCSHATPLTARTSGPPPPCGRFVRTLPAYGLPYHWGYQIPVIPASLWWLLLQSGCVPASLWWLLLQSGCVPTSLWQLLRCVPVSQGIWHPRGFGIPE